MYSDKLLRYRSNCPEQFPEQVVSAPEQLLDCTTAPSVSLLVSLGPRHSAHDSAAHMERQCKRALAESSPGRSHLLDETRSDTRSPRSIPRRSASCLNAAFDAVDCGVASAGHAGLQPPFSLPGTPLASASTAGRCAAVQSLKVAPQPVPGSVDRPSIPCGIPFGLSYAAAAEAADAAAAAALT